MVVRGAILGRKTRRVPWTVWGAAVAVAVVVLGGSVLAWRGCSRGSGDPYAAWGGMSKEEWLEKRKQRETAEAKQDAAARKQAEAKKKAEETKNKKPAEAKIKKIPVAGSSMTMLAGDGQLPEEKPALGSGTPATPDAPRSSSPPLPPLPQEYAQWKDMDYFVARLTGNPRLVLAVQYRSERMPPSEEHAKFFRNLLAPQLLAELKALVGSRKPTAPTERNAPTAVIEAIAAALGRNGTSVARQTLADLLAGTLTIENDQAAVGAALKALAENPCEANDRLLAAALTQPETLRPPGQSQGKVTPEALQKQALGMVQQGGTSGVRLLAARRFVDPACPAELRKLLAPLWSKPHPENLEAYVLLCDSDDLDGQVKTQIRKHLVEASGQAMQHFLGIADGRAVPSADSEWPYRVARRLWTAQFGLVFDARRTTVRSIDEARDLVLLAATVPRSDVRARLQRILERRWEEGPAALKSAGWAQTILSEPGILAVLKSTRRNRPVTAQPESKDRGNSVQQRKERRESKEKKEKKDPWLDAEELLVGEFCRRFSLAALSQVRSATATPRPTPALPDESHDPPFPVALHSRAAVVAKYRVQWPGNHAGKLADTAPDPMEISYLRIEQKARPWSVRGHYERAVKGHKVHPLKDGIWIEAIVPAAKEGRTRSIDVLLTRANPKAETPPDEAQELTVEILTVDIPPLEVAGGVSRRTATDPDADASP